MILTLPFPPSTNRIWRHVGTKVLLSREGRAYRQRVAEVVMLARVQSFGRHKLTMVIDASMPDARRRDLDNLLKAAQDAMQAARVYEDDSQIIDLRIRHAGIDRANPRLDVTLEAA
jgi:Holliday junction resolvase RusA-like endonuclease